MAMPIARVSKPGLVVVLGFIAVAALGFSVMRAVVSRDSPHFDDVRSEYRWLWDPPRPSGEALRQTYSVAPFDSISLERERCHGKCPVYVITLRRNGTASFVGESPFPRKGTYTGRFSRWDFARLCYVIEENRVLEMDPEYSRPAMHEISAVVRVYRSGEADPQRVRDYGQYGPLALWTVAQTIDGIGARIKWVEK